MKIARKKSQEESITRLTLRLWSHLSGTRQRQFFMVLALMVLAALSEVISLGAIVPFLAVIVDPERVLKLPLAKWASQVLNINTSFGFILALMTFFCVAAVAAGIIRMTLLWANSRLAYACGSDLSFDIFEKTLHQPYRTHLNRNSSEVKSGLDYKVSYTVNVLLQVLNLISSSLLAIAIIATLILLNPLITLLAASFFLTIYLIYSWVMRKRLVMNSKIIALQSTQVVQCVEESLGGIREVLLGNLQNFYCNKYKKSDLLLRNAMGGNNFISQSPRYAMESIGMVLLIGLTYFLLVSGSPTTSLIPILGALALGAQRLLPCSQQCYAAWASILGSKAALREALEFLDQPSPKLFKNQSKQIIFKESICFQNVNFAYSSNTPLVLKNLSFEIPKGKSIAIVGETGGGKSTILDLIMGLLRQTSGEILIDGTAITDSVMESWRCQIAHVSQSIYLSDTTVAQNIAFGIPLENIDYTLLHEVIRRALLEDLIETLADGIEGTVGERGARLSGGQRQRIGIARALYRGAKILVLDEATSALDATTEKKLLPSLMGDTSNPVTVIMVAHRLSTVKNCDTIIELANGSIIAQGSYDELIKKSKSFFEMTKNTIGAT